MSSGFSTLGLADRQFELSKELKDLTDQLNETSDKTEINRLKTEIKTHVIKSKEAYEARWNTADIYEDHEVKSYTKRMRRELMKWAKTVIDISGIQLEDLW